jgi:ABC-type lipoprotein release transport system permease subunit
MLLSLAWRNLWRNKLRSAIIITAIAIGIIGGIVADGMMTGMTDQRINAAIANELSNIQIQNPQFLLNNEIKYLIPQSGNIVETIKGYKEVKGVSSRFECEAMASSANAGGGVTVYGVVPSDEAKVSDIKKHIVKGSYLNDKQRIPAVIGEKLAEKLDLGLDDRIIITLADTTGTITSGAFQIVGIFKTSNNIFDVANVFVRKKDLAPVIGLHSQTAHQIAVRLKNNDNTDKVMSKIYKDFKTLVDAKRITVRSWHEISPLLRSMVEIMNMFSFIFMLIVLIALAFAIVNTMVMSIMERTRELGMLIALGLNKRRTFALIMFETLLLSLTGAVLGLLVSLLIVHHYAVSGFDLSAFGEGLNSLGYSAIIYFRVNTDFYFTTIVLVVLIALVSTISPARKALKLQPATAIRDDTF